MRPTVTILSHDLSNNCLGRAHVLAQLLAPAFDVEIVGPREGDAVWLPLREQTEIPVRDLGRCGVEDVVDAVTGDLVYAVKPKSTSMLAAVAAVRRRPRPLLADVDDYEMGFYRQNLPWAVRSCLPPWRSNGLLATRRAQRLVEEADLVTVSTQWLQRRFGGLVVPHARPRTAADVDLAAARARRHEWGLGDGLLLLFLGSVRRHKLAPLIAALDTMREETTAGQVRLLVVGDGDELPQRGYLTRLPPQPFTAVPEIVAGADVVVLAQDASLVAQAQLPAKIFDAMAVGVPVVASDISDISEVLGEGGMVVPPGDTQALASAIRLLRDEPQVRARLGLAARERFLRHYTVEQLSPWLCERVGSLLPRPQRVA